MIDVANRRLRTPSLAVLAPFLFFLTACLLLAALGALERTVWFVFLTFALFLPATYLAVKVRQ